MHDSPTHPYPLVVGVASCDSYRVRPHVDVLVLPVWMGQDEAQVAADGEGVVVRSGFDSLVEIFERDSPQRAHAHTLHLATTCGGSR